MIMYADGISMVKDKAKAAELYKRAADGGSSLAVSSLDFIYKEYRGVERSRAKALEL